MCSRVLYVSQVLGEGVCVQWLLVAREEYPCVVGSLHQGVGGITVLWRRGGGGGGGGTLLQLPPGSQLYGNDVTIHTA